jgi:hypothetical protein
LQPESLARSLILLCKGCGVLSGVAIPGMERQRTLSGYSVLFIRIRNTAGVNSQ